MHFSIDTRRRARDLARDVATIVTQPNEHGENAMPFDPSKITLSAADREFIQWYDKRCKRVLSNKMLLAHLLKATMREYHDIDPEVICRRYIEGTPGVESDADYIVGLRNERDDPHREPNFFDILFYALLPNSEQTIPIIINVEAQERFSLEHPPQKRASFYATCISADQKDTIFAHNDYESLRKVCSIWICTHPPKEYGNGIARYAFKQENLLGQCPEIPIDTIEIVFVYLAGSHYEDYTGIISLLDACLSRNFNKDMSRDISNKYNVHLDSEDDNMTAGEQIIYGLYEDLWDAKEAIKEVTKERDEMARERDEMTRERDEMTRERDEMTREHEKSMANAAKVMKENGIALDVIVQSTGLSREQIMAM